MICIDANIAEFCSTMTPTNAAHTATGPISGHCGKNGINRRDLEGGIEVASSLPNISGQKLKVLKHLRIYEPCSCAELAKHIDGLDRETVYRCLYQLGELDLVDSPVRACYVLTGKGKRIFKRETEQPLFKGLK